MFRQLFIIITTIFIFLFAGYWAKCYLGWNFSDRFSLGDYLPVQFMYNKNAGLILAKRPGELFDDSFDGGWPLKNWRPLWAREPGTVEAGLDAPGRKGARCLLITNNSTKDWEYSYSKLIKAEPGDIFTYRGYVKLAGCPIKASFSVVLYDSGREPFDRGFAREEMAVSEDWKQYARQFTLPEGAAYFRFHMTGKGEGKVWFDEVALDLNSHM